MTGDGSLPFFKMKIKNIRYEFSEMLAFSKKI